VSKGEAGRTAFRALAFLPSSPPENFYSKTYIALKSLRLFVRRVFITSDVGPNFLPRWLNWVKVTVDADDLSLNVGRDSLQKSKDLIAIKRNLIKKVRAPCTSVFPFVCSHSLACDRSSISSAPRHAIHPTHIQKCSPNLGTHSNWAPSTITRTGPSSSNSSGSPLRQPKLRLLWTTMYLGGKRVRNRSFSLRGRGRQRKSWQRASLSKRRLRGDMRCAFFVFYLASIGKALLTFWRKIGLVFYRTGRRNGSFGRRDLWRSSVSWCGSSSSIGISWGDCSLQGCVLFRIRRRKEGNDFRR
jgi:hypothetical protein